MKIIYQFLIFFCILLFLQQWRITEVKAQTFHDLPMNEESKEAILRLVDKGIIKGYADGTFRPYDPVTRSQAAALMARSLKLTGEPTIELAFTDLTPQSANYLEIAQLTEKGIFNNVQKFNPGYHLTRAQMAKILTLGFGLRQVDYTYSNFRDVADSSAVSVYIETLRSLAITTGKTIDTYDPNGTVTRLQLVLFIDRTLKAIELNPLFALSDDRYAQYVAASFEGIDAESKTELEQSDISYPSNLELTSYKPIDSSLKFSNYEDIQYEFIRQLNAYRETIGNDYTLYERKLNLTYAAGFRSWDMATNGYFSHVSPTYGGVDQLFYYFQPENLSGTEVITSVLIGRGAAEDAKVILNNFLNSPPHKAVLLERWRTIGVGIHTGGDGFTTYVTVVLSY